MESCVCVHIYISPLLYMCKDDLKLILEGRLGPSACTVWILADTATLTPKRQASLTFQQPAVHNCLTPCSLYLEIIHLISVSGQNK